MSTNANTKTALDEFFSSMPKVATESFMEKVDIKDMQNPAKDNMSTSQQSLGKEQSGEARNGGSTVETIADNKESDADRPTDNQGPSTLTTDDPVKSQGNLGPTRSQEITQEQKTAADYAARSMRQASAMRRILGMAKQAEEYGSDGEQSKKDESEEDEGNYNFGDPDGGEEEGSGKEASDPYAGLSKEAAAAMQDFDEFEKYAAATADNVASHVFNNMMEGYLARKRDEQDFIKSDLYKAAMAAGKIKGPEDVPALIAKQAMDDPMSAMPAPVVGEAEEMDQAASMLGDAGVNPEDLQAAEEVVMELVEANIPLEDIQAAVAEIVGEGLAEEGDASVEKVASDDFRRRAAIEAVKGRLLQKSAAYRKIAQHGQARRQKGGN